MERSFSIRSQLETVLPAATCGKATDTLRRAYGLRNRPCGRKSGNSSLSLSAVLSSGWIFMMNGCCSLFGSVWVFLIRLNPIVRSQVARTSIDCSCYSITESVFVYMSIYYFCCFTRVYLYTLFVYEWKIEKLIWMVFLKKRS